jgi:hypothetical protein
MLEHSPKFGTRGLTFAPVWTQAYYSELWNAAMQALFALYTTRARKHKLPRQNLKKQQTTFSNHGNPQEDRPL